MKQFQKNNHIGVFGWQKHHEASFASHTAGSREGESFVTFFFLIKRIKGLTICFNIDIDIDNYVF
jgi:hypothetical protein